MTKYFMHDTHLAGLEAEMMLAPFFTQRTSGVMILSRFHYDKKSTNCKDCVSYVFEAPIDLLSYISLHQEDWRKHSYVSLCGTSEHAMLWMLEQYPQLGEIALCLDNDDAGVKAAERLTEILAEHGYGNIRIDHSEEKDWNDELVRACESEEKMTMEME